MPKSGLVRKFEREGREELECNHRHDAMLKDNDQTKVHRLIRRQLYAPKFSSCPIWVASRQPRKFHLHSAPEQGRETNGQGQTERRIEAFVVSGKRLGRKVNPPAWTIGQQAAAEENAGDGGSSRHDD